MGPMSVIPTAALRRGPEDWLEDLGWHKRMYAQSHFRWVPEDAMTLALSYTRGRILFETTAHLRALDEQIMRLRQYTKQIEDAMAAPLRQARGCCTAQDWGEGLELLRLTELDVRIIQGTASTGDPSRNPEVRRALRGWPLPNPLTQVWELRQMVGMYRAADDILEDTLCDFATELAPTRGWEVLAALTTSRYGQLLIRRVQDQHGRRGSEATDPRRAALQRY